MKTIVLNLDNIRIEGTVIDVETTSLEPDDGYILTFGYITGSQVVVWQIESENERTILVQDVIPQICTSLPRPWFAYNKGFEEKWLRNNVDVDLMEKWKSKAESDGLKWPKMRELIRPPLFYYRLIGTAEADRQKVPDELIQGLRGPYEVSAVNEVMRQEIVVADAIPDWWDEHIRHLNQYPDIAERYLTCSKLSEAEELNLTRPAWVIQLPTGEFTTVFAANIMIHNLNDLLGEASLLIWESFYQVGPLMPIR